MVNYRPLSHPSLGQSPKTISHLSATSTSSKSKAPLASSYKPASRVGTSKSPQLTREVAEEPELLEDVEDSPFDDQDDQRIEDPDQFEELDEELGSENNEDANANETEEADDNDRSGADEVSAKRRKITSTVSFTLEPEKLQLLSLWNLAHDRASLYVMQEASIEETMAIGKTGWRPSATLRADGREGKTPAEQLNEKILSVREESYGPQGGRAVDVVAAFVRKWQLAAKDEAALRKACAKDLRFVMKEFDGSRSVSELLDEAELAPHPEMPCDSAEDAAGEELGVLTCGRLNRLELIDPIADALVVGDANLTFSILLAKHREALGHVGRIVATTFETIEILRERYPEIDATVKELESKDAEVFHNVDGTRLAVDSRFQDMVKKFGAVYYNFPHAGVVQGFFDGHPFVRWRHENLMHLFFRALRGFVKPNGLVKVSSNSGARGVRFSDIIAGAHNSEFVHVETMPFQEWSLRGYRRSYGDRRDANRRPEENENYRSQSANSDMVYTFRYLPSGDPPPKALIRRPPTKNDLLMSAEGKLRGMGQEQRQRKAEEIYELFLTYVQGIHVG